MTLQPATAPTHRPHPLTRAELARRAGRSRGAITLALQGPLAAACLDGGRVDALHPVLVAFARRHWGIGPMELTDGAACDLPAPQPVAARAAVGVHAGSRARSTDASPRDAERVESTPLREEPAIDSLLDLTVRQITDRYGSTQACADHVLLRKQIAATMRLELANHEREGRLIPRDFVATHMFGAIDRAFLLLLRDMPVTLAPRTRAAVVGGEPNEELVSIIRNQVSEHLVRLKTQMMRALREPHEREEASNDDE